jgi:thioredoxin reductase (NADPH)
MNKPQTDIHNVIIIGSGPAGLTAGIYTGRAFLKPLLFEGSAPGGQLMGTTAVENWPGNKSIMGPQLVMNIKEQAQHFGTQILSEQVVSVDFSQRPFTIQTNSGNIYKSNSVIISTGASANKLGCPGEQDYWGKGVTVCAVCDGAFYPNKKVVIVGGGDTAMEDASFMTKYTSDITIVHIFDKLTASPVMQQRVLNNKNIKILYNHTVTQVIGNGNHVTNVVVTNQKTHVSTTLSADVMFLAIGQKPNTHLFKEQLELDRMGYIVTRNGTLTSVAGVFAAGDVVDFKYRQAIVSAGTGCMAALDCQRFLETL